MRFRRKPQPLFRVNANCPHGSFVPGTYTGRAATRWGCDECDFHFSVTPAVTDHAPDFHLKPHRGMA